MTEPDLSQLQMVEDLTEYELNFIDFATVVAIALERYAKVRQHELP